MRKVAVNKTTKIAKTVLSVLNDVDIDQKVDEIWETVYAKNRTLMIDWIECFSGDFRERKPKSKWEIKMTLTQKEYQTDPRKNFLWRLMSREPWIYGYKDLNGTCKCRADLAMLFMQVMMDHEYWEDFIVTTLGHKHSILHHTNFRPMIKTTWDETTTQLITTELHDAARFEDTKKVQRLIEGREIMSVNKNGYTQLHFIAMAINPNAEIAKLLIDSVTVNIESFLDKQTADDMGKNTALHIAAANVNVTEEFIQQFKEADSLLRNSKNDTPFHVAAKSRNRDAIIYMLNTFKPTNNCWDVDKVDELQEYQNMVINICARNGNAKAVALLIKHGADISRLSSSPSEIRGKLTTLCTYTSRSLIMQLPGGI